MAEPLGEPYVTVNRLPDGRWGAQNARDLSDMTKEDMQEIAAAFQTWFSIHWSKREFDRPREDVPPA